MKKLLLLAALFCSCSLFSMNEDTVRYNHVRDTVIYIHQDEVFTLNQTEMGYKVPVDVLEDIKKNLQGLVKELERNTDSRDFEARRLIAKGRKNIKLLEDNFYV